MTPLAHLSSSYVIYAAVSGTVEPSNGALLIVAIAGSLIPDLDGLRSAQFKDHRNTFLHAPLFWLALLIISLLVHKFTEIGIGYIAVFFVGAFFHLFLDWFSGRTDGLRMWYPFSRKSYSLFPTKPHMGEIQVLPNKKHKQFWEFYFENKFLIVSEGILIISPIVIYFLCK